jgi:hypothetical protein
MVLQNLDIFIQLPTVHNLYLLIEAYLDCFGCEARK